MTLNFQLACAARRVRAASERLPEQHRPDVAAEWSDLLDRIEHKSGPQAHRLIDEWAAEMEQRLARALLNCPLEVHRS